MYLLLVDSEWSKLKHLISAKQKVPHDCAVVTLLLTAIAAVTSHLLGTSVKKANYNIS